MAYNLQVDFKMDGPFVVEACSERETSINNEEGFIQKI